MDKFLFISDPGHGWLKVSVLSLAPLGLSLGSFSPFSYRSGYVAYLEEDCDAGVFIDAWKKAHPGEEFPVEFENYDCECFIRNLPYIH